MKLGEVSILTGDVVRLANFYKGLLEIDNGSDDAVHQTIIADETMLTIFNDGREPREYRGQNMCLAFTVDDIDKEYQRVHALGVEMIEKPTARPWGAINMSFADPDGNIVYLRSFPKQ